jgi:hypothetical protein
MFSNRWLRRLRSTSRPTIRAGKGPPPCNPVRPSLEALEERLTPFVAFPTVTSISAAAPIFSLFDQTETVTTQTNWTNGLGVTEGVDGVVASLGGFPTQPQSMTITDGGQTQTVKINSTGQATATFKFNLLQELQNKTFGSHPISATFSGAPAGVESQFWGSSTVSGTAPGNSAALLVQLFVNYYLYTNFVAAHP